MKIRKGCAKDIKGIILLWLSFFKDDTKKIAMRYLSDKVKENEIIISENKKELAGFLTFKKNYFFESDYIEALIIAPHHRHKGIGSAIIKECEKQSAKRKRRRLFVSSEHWNKEAMKFHIKMGFKKCGYLDDVWGEGKRDIFFSKKL